MRLLVIGAHPDDPDIRAGGLACTLAAADHDVRFLSLTNGNKGHHEQRGMELANRRQSEAQAAAEIAGLDGYDLLNIPDGELQPTLDNRKTLIRYIREYDPHLILTHRPNDYHPDHRYTSQLVQDAAYMVTVPKMCPETPHLADDPVICYLTDEFHKPYPFSPDVVVPIDQEDVKRKYDMLHQHTSQLYEWLAYNHGYLDDVPDEEEERREFLETDPLNAMAEMSNVADRFRDRLVARYGEEQGNAIEYAEAFEACEYGAPLTDDRIPELFPI
ncbi:PIG-L deacetylase family protein [Halorussus salinisoli]|uniref:PIG-L deacetylase family protein n=1 Tax=Halorussus salinisoli TaxID=2558242 RepID=UPI0010C189EC|nr:PIG-L family deacetylase [Halorussus salinisoli]